MNFRTEIIPKRAAALLSHQDRLLAMGSCFAASIGARLQAHKFNVLANPLGVIYNPLSIAQALCRIAEGAGFAECDFMQQGELWHSLHLHGDFSGPDLGACLSLANARLEAARKQLRQSSCLMLTLGSAWAYTHLPTGILAANCHKISSKQFVRHLLSCGLIEQELDSCFQKLFACNQELKIIYTISPIRHWKDGAEENMLSKAALFVAMHTLAQKYPDRLAYFPAYELLMDDLRDYRFYEQDMIHPSSQAVDYIYQKFAGAHYSPDTQLLCRQVEAAVRASMHRPYNPDTDSHRQFVKKTLEEMSLIEQLHPSIDFSPERQRIIGASLVP